MAGILVLAELTKGALDTITGQLLAAARGLGGEVAVALLGDSSDEAARDAIASGADRVLEVRDPLLADGSPDAQVAAVEQVCRQTAPAVILVGRTAIGRDVGPRLAFRLGVGLAQDCIDIRLDSDTNRVVATRPVYGGNALATVTFSGADPQVVILRDKVYEPLPPDSSRTGDVVELSVQLDPSVVRVRHVESVVRERVGVRLEDAKVVISGGRGLGGPEPFERLQELADLLGGALGASRAACDSGWLDHDYQIGLTGKTVTPDLYITFGISGASQHMAGCSGAKHIVAVNRDPDANIFREAKYGVVGDWDNVLTSFVETVRELVSS